MTYGLYFLQNIEDLAARHGDYNLSEALAANGTDGLPLMFSIAGEILSEDHDEGTYYWLLYDCVNFTYCVVSGGHDYTGWGCQSNIAVTESFADLGQIGMYVEQFDNQVRPVRDLLLEHGTEFEEWKNGKSK